MDSDLRTLSIKRIAKKLLFYLELSLARSLPFLPDMRPDFICIGAPRSATTWLFKVLAAQPDLAIPWKKELHFFDERPQIVDNHDFGFSLSREFYFDLSKTWSWRWYSLQFYGPTKRLRGEITPAYSTLSEHTVAVIKKAMPELKVIYVLREPVSRAWSGLRKTLATKANLGVDSFQEYKQLLMSDQMLERGNYVRAISTWEAHYDPSQILYLFYDDIVEEPRKQIERVYDFLGLPFNVDAEGFVEGKVNSAPQASMPKDIEQVLAQHYSHQIDFLEKKFCRDLTSWRYDID